MYFDIFSITESFIYYQKIKNVLNDPHEEKAAENLFNETSIDNF